MSPTRTISILEDHDLLDKANGKKRSKSAHVQAFLNSLVADPERLTTLLKKKKTDFFFQFGANLVADFEKASAPSRAEQQLNLHTFLNLARQNALLKEIYNEHLENEWFELVLKIIKTSNFTLSRLIQQRVEQYGNKCIFKTIHEREVVEFSWAQLDDRLLSIASALFEYRRKHKITGPVAILSENSQEMVLLDLACLCMGMVDVLIPANSVAMNVEYILNHSQATLLFVSNEKQLAKLADIRKNLPHVHSIILIDSSRSIAMGDVLTFKAFLKYGDQADPLSIRKHMQEVRINDVATYMYTSGTTEASKGIIFTHLNIISKRFARAIALPEIGDRDVFLCYLPLFHTFGRYFEMMGCLFWGSTYVFMESPKVDTMISNMQDTRPTVFISIPKKWIQLFEKIAEQVDIDTAPKELIKETADRFTGGELRWGLSAAGYLDPDIFRFFQQNGIEIMSGFGMTEATGGITMTPPFQYRTNSVGKALPGIEIKLADDGEMLIRGPYVMQGYLHSTDTGLDRQGWFRTGDIFTRDKDGFYEIVDRKKEIYKNIRGETIAPQRIENLFQDFDAVKRVFLVGDNREYNTVLIYPNWEYEQLNLRKLSQFKLREFFSSLIVSVNRFLAPYERIINFELIPRDFEVEKGELTPKGTFKRKVVEQNFKEYIEKMYSSDFVSFRAGRFEIRIPNWFLREKGITPNDLIYAKHHLRLRNRRVKLTIKPGMKNSCKVMVGSYWYCSEQNFIDLSQLIFHPVLWLGNEEFQQFVGDSIYTSVRDHDFRQIKLNVLIGRTVRPPKQKSVMLLKRYLAQGIISIEGLHVAASILSSLNSNYLDLAMTYFERVIRRGENLLADIARTLMHRYALADKPTVKKQALWVLLITEKTHDFKPIFENYIKAVGRSLNKTTLTRFAEQNFVHAQLKYIFEVLDEYAVKENWARLDLQHKTLISLLNLITEYGIKHPAAFKSIRTELVNWSLIEFDDKIRRHARACVDKLILGFRKWLGGNLSIAVDPETSLEYGWEEVVTFEDEIDAEHRRRIFSAIKKYPVIREAIFLFTRGTLVQLQEIAPKGIWISQLGTMHGKTVYRVSVQTHHFGAFDLAINVNNSLRREEIQSETDWLICAGAMEERHPLVEDFGGYWPEFDLWTEEFIHGDTVDKFLARLTKQSRLDQDDKLQFLWLYLAWSGISAYVDFWCRTGRRLEIADPTPANVIVPAHDYQIGFRIISISNRKPFKSVWDMMLSFSNNFIAPVEQKYEILRGVCKTNVLFASFLEILGEQEGLQVLNQALKSLKRRKSKPEHAELAAKLSSFTENVRERGYRPKRLYFAIKRFRRWVNLNPEATAFAKMQTLQELHTTYTLADLESFYPGTRIQYFRDTVFAKAAPDVIAALNDIIKDLKKNPQNEKLVIEKVSKMTEVFHFTDEEKAFLARMTYQHLGHKDSAEIVSLKTPGQTHSALMTFIQDNEGNRYGVRNPANPKEIARLYKLFNSANLPVEFRNEHHYLVVLNERIQVIGGLFYRQIDAQNVHLEKIVVDARYRRKGVSDGLMKEFFNRVESQGAKIVTVGFFRPEYFYKFGFKIDQRYGNMVKRFEKKRKKEKAEDMVERL